MADELGRLRAVRAVSKDRSKSVDTAAVGYGAVAAGGAVRANAIDEAHRALGRTKRARPPSAVMLQLARSDVPRKAKMLRRWGGGTAAITVGAPAAAVGTYDLLHHKKVAKAQDKPNPVAQGLAGTEEAWKAKAASVRSGAPPKVRLRSVAIGASGAGLGGLAAHRGLDRLARRVRVRGGVRGAVTAAAAIPGALATLPLSRRVARRSGYDVGPTGTTAAAANPDARVAYREPEGVMKARNDYPGRHLSSVAQRAQITAAGAVPGPAGPIGSATMAAHLAPPGEQRQAAARQVAGGSAAGLAGGAATGLTLGHLATKSPKVEHGVRRVISEAGKANARLPKKIQRFSPLRVSEHLSPRKAGLAVGFLAGRAVAGAVGNQAAISRNLAAERRYNQAHPLSKATGNEQLTPTQTRQLVRRKRFGAAVSTASAGTGLSALAMIKAHNPVMRERRNKLLAVTAGLGGVNALNSASVARREARAEKATLSKYTDAGNKRMSRAGTDIATAGLVGATGAGAAIIPTHSPRMRKYAAPLHRLKAFEKTTAEGIRGKSEKIALVSATAGGAGQLLDMHARKRRRRYAAVSPVSIPSTGGPA